MLREHSKPRGVSRAKRVRVALEDVSDQKRSTVGRTKGIKQRARANALRHSGKDPSLRAGTKTADYTNSGEKGVQKIIATHQAKRNGS